MTTSTGAREKLDDAHAEYARTRDRRVRNELVVAYQPFARHLALRFRRSSEPLDDLVQAATVGLVGALDRYDPARGQFTSYAGRVILGELKRHFRDRSWPLHVPRGLQERALLVRDAIGPLRHDLGRAPTVDEVGDALALDAEEVREAIAVLESYRPQSLDAPRPDDPNAERRNIPTTESGFERVDSAIAGRQTVARLVRRLSDDDRELLSLYYAEGLTQVDIARRLDTTQVRVSRRLQRVRRHLRAAAAAAS